jgi:hypothetical protein
MSDSYLLYAGWIFFAAWSVVVGVVTIKAFGPDLFPSRVTHDSAPKVPPQDLSRTN